jgi:hypothetical protein
LLGVSFHGEEADKPIDTEKFTIHSLVIMPVRLEFRRYLVQNLPRAPLCR